MKRNKQDITFIGLSGLVVGGVVGYLVEKWFVNKFITPLLTTGSHIKIMGGSITIWSDQPWLPALRGYITQVAVSKINLAGVNPEPPPDGIPLNSGWKMSFTTSTEPSITPPQGPSAPNTRACLSNSNLIVELTTESTDQNRPEPTGNFSHDCSLEPGTAIGWYGKHYQETSPCGELCEHIKDVSIADGNGRTWNFTATNVYCEIEFM